MRAVQYVTEGAAPRVVSVAEPEPGPGQLLVRVTAAGVCHSDLTVMEMTEKQRGYPLPLTLGHEVAGIVEAVGSTMTTVSVGEPVLVYGPWGCGTCRPCSRGMENYCVLAERLGIHPPGLGAPGGLADYMIVDSERHVVPLGSLDPVRSVPLTDAGLTPFHAIRRAMGNLYPGSFVVVIGVGGLGHVAVQLLRAMTATTIVALDTREESLELARWSGADQALPSDDRAADTVRELTDGLGANAVFDFVGAQQTMDLMVAVAAKDSHLVEVGIGSGRLPFSFLSLPSGTTTGVTYWGGRSELIELLNLARADAVSVHVERYSLEQAPEVYDRMRQGLIQGRAVVVPEG